MMQRAPYQTPQYICLHIKKQDTPVAATHSAHFLLFFSLSLAPADPPPRLSSVPARRRCRTRAPRQHACKRVEVERCAVSM